jgi:hypothetical protein
MGYGKAKKEFFLTKKIYKRRTQAFAWGEETWAGSLLISSLVYGRSG